MPEPIIDFAFTVSKGWMARALGVRFDRDYYMDPLRRQTVDRQCNAYLDEHHADLGLFFTESNLGRRAFYEPKQALVGGIQPNMILGMLVGAEFRPADDKDADISPTPLAAVPTPLAAVPTPLAAVEPDDLPEPRSLLDHPLISLFDEQYGEVARQGTDDEKPDVPQGDPRPSLVPIPPFFWDASGRAAVHGTLTTAQKLFGEQVLMDVATDPQRVEAVFDWVTDATIALVRHFAMLSQREIDQLHVGECSGCMVSGPVFEQFIVPTLSRYGRELGPVRLHSCGKSDHLLDAMAKVENLGSLDVGGETSMARVRDRFGSDLPVDIAPLVDDLRAPTPDALLGWANRVLDQNAGGRLTFVVHLEEGYPLDNLRALRRHVSPDRQQ
jgi:hypothetical protein